MGRLHQHISNVLRPAFFFFFACVFFVASYYYSPHMLSGDEGRGRGGQRRQCGGVKYTVSEGGWVVAWSEAGGAAGDVDDLLFCSPPPLPRSLSHSALHHS